LTNKAIKHFTAYDPVAKWTLGHVATKASALSAKALLDKLCARAPFPATGIQVDSGSEFKAAFEQACADKGLALFVLPPKTPQLNAAVKRNQGAWRYEFYSCFELPHRIDKLQLLIDGFAHRLNHRRPHQALGDLTPAEYLKALGGGDSRPSHM
jgi:transposase InsO family protein